MVEELGIGIVGFGFIGKVHAYAYLNMPIFYDPPPCRTNIVGVADVRPEIASAIRDQIPVEFTTHDHRELIERDDIQVIHVCTPNDSHRQIILDALAAGKHVCCDKPLCLNSSEAEEILSALSGYQGINMMSFEYRFIPAMLRAKQLVDEGFLGRILSFRAVYLHSGYVDPKRPMSWRLDRAKSGGGALFDLGTHIVDLLQHLMGPFSAVQATTETFFRERPDPKTGKPVPVEVDDLALMTVRTPDGALGTIEVSRVATGVNDELRFEIHGTDGAMRFNLMDPNWLEVYNNREAGEPIGGTRGFKKIETVGRYPKPGGFPGPKFAIGWIRGHMAAIHHFVNSIVEGRPVRPDLRDGARLQQFLDLAYASSAKKGTWLPVPEEWRR
jgi:predicted dehydrogenase